MVAHYPALNRPEAPDCSVCIANYNGVGMLADCVDSVLAQQGDIGIEIIVHDDASSDDSVALLRTNYPQIELLASRENVGFCVANNRMVAHARGDFVLLLNNDAALYPDALLTLIEAARLQSSAGIVTLPQYDWETGVLVDRGCLLDPFYNPVPNLDPRRRDVAMVIGACLWVARDVWNELGGFPEWLESIGEDMYLCCVARLRGRPVQVTGASGYRHRQGVSFGGNRVTTQGLQTTFRRRYLSERNKIRVMVVCTPTLLVIPQLMLHILLLIIEGITLTAVRRDARIWHEIYGRVGTSVLRGFSTLWAKRHQEQRLRVVSLHGFLRPFVWMHRKLGLLYRYGMPRIR
ncbi:glycosyltransferase family 2 protein [Dyella psychrodurans]|uniref:Glycosyltransferase n=1 Tax=Dyella psychrodurans TaxID=1927960 RepID=A0A370XAH9_9GAMM|nr:glycosyltransferase [Dyella psychrodurans]RDS85292.1 glycosyltransferase [Dyella psychrodurans]